MNRQPPMLWAMAALPALSGCQPTIHHIDQLGDTQQVVSIDAKQHFPISGTDSAGRTVNCAEPGPDVFSA